MVIDMEKTKEIAVLEKEVNQSLTFAESIVITNDEQMLAAGKFRSGVKEKLKLITEEKEKATKPLNDSLKVIRSWFTKIEEDGKNIVSLVGSKMGCYQMEVDAKKRKLEIEAQKKIEEARKKLEEGKITEKQADKVAEKQEIKLDLGPNVITKSADFHTRTDRKVRFTDVRIMSTAEVKKLIDGGYLVWDEVKGRKDALAGSLSVGVEVYEQKTLI